MGTLRNRLRHAFAVDPDGPAEPTGDQQVVVDWLAGQVARRHLTTPGVFGLEMIRPLNWVGAQAMHMTSPGVSMLCWAIGRDGVADHYRHLAAFLERRGSLEHIARRVEHFEAEYDRREREARAPADPSDHAPSEKDDADDRP